MQLELIIMLSQGKQEGESRVGSLGVYPWDIVTVLQKISHSHCSVCDN